MGLGRDMGGRWAASICPYRSWGDPMGPRCSSECPYGVGVLMGVMVVTPGSNGCSYRSWGVPMGLGVLLFCGLPYNSLSIPMGLWSFSEGSYGVGTRYGWALGCQHLSL